MSYIIYYIPYTIYDILYTIHLLYIFYTIYHNINIICILCDIPYTIYYILHRIYHILYIIYYILSNERRPNCAYIWANWNTVHLIKLWKPHTLQYFPISSFSQHDDHCLSLVFLVFRLARSLQHWICIGPTCSPTFPFVKTLKTIVFLWFSKSSRFN